jgi:hypothetical protein
MILLSRKGDDKRLICRYNLKYPLNQSVFTIE